MLDTALLIAQSSTKIEVGAGGGLVFGIICAVIAPGRGRSALAWFFLGFFFSCLALIILLLLPNLNDIADQQRAADKELRRLREQVKKERQVADGRHEGNRSRIDAHDRALGMDTSGEEPEQVEDAPPAHLPAPPPPPQPPPPTGDQEVTWFFVEEGAQIRLNVVLAGKVTVEEVCDCRQ